MSKFVISDIHGAHKALVECLKGVKFDYATDQLIFLGDVVDGWSESIECIEELLKIKHLIYIRGNHDEWALKYLRGQMVFKMSSADSSWLHHGGVITKDRLDQNPDKCDMVKSFIESGVKYYIDDDNNIYTHAGFNQNEPIEQQAFSVFLWDRNMVLDTINGGNPYSSSDTFYDPKNKYNKIYIGHTPTTYLAEDSIAPMKLGVNTILLDTGAGFTGKLTIMNVDDGSIFQSTPPCLLYPNEKGRN